LGDRSSETFKQLWLRIKAWNSYFYVTDGYPVYPCFINQEDHIVSKTYMTRVEGENSRLRHYLARLKRKTFCYSKSVEMLELSIRLARLLSQKSLYSDAGAKPLRGYGVTPKAFSSANRVIHIVIQQHRLIDIPSNGG